MPSLPQKTIDEIFHLDDRYKIIEDSERFKEGDVHHLRHQEIRRLRMDLMELLNYHEKLYPEEIERKLQHQTILLEKMEEESNNNTPA